MLENLTFPCGDNGQLDVQLGMEPGTNALPEACAEAAAAASHRISALAHSPLPWLITVRIGDADEGQRLNRDFRGKDYATNVLSFPSDEEDAMDDGAEEWYVGDIFICLPVVVREAAEQDKRLLDHLRHLVVHGVLHLNGYDHMETAEAEAMEKLETEILAELGIDDPYTMPLENDR